MDFILSFNNNYWNGTPQMIFPVVPNGGISLERDQNNASFDGVNGEMLSIGNPNLSSFTVESFFPNKYYSFMRPGSSTDGWSYVRTIERVRKERIPFRAVHLDNHGNEVFNLAVSVESFNYGLDRAGDIRYNLGFREYRFATMETADLAANPTEGLTEVKKIANIQPVTATASTTSVTSAGTAPAIALYTESDAVMMAKTMYGEARGLRKIEVACVGWCILNRVDSSSFPNTIAGVITQRSQFSGWKSTNPTKADLGFDLVDLAKDVCNRWSREKAGESSVGRVLPPGYCWFKGISGHNYFRKDNKSQKAGAWDYSWPSPY